MTPTKLYGPGFARGLVFSMPHVQQDFSRRVAGTSGADS